MMIFVHAQVFLTHTSHLLFFSTCTLLQQQKVEVIFDPSSFANAKHCKTATILIFLLALAVGNIFKYCPRETILSFLTCPMVSYTVRLLENTLSFADMQNSQFMSQLLNFPSN